MGLSPEVSQEAWGEQQHHATKQNINMRKYIVLYFAAIAHTILSFFVLLKSINADFERWRVVCAAVAFLVFLTLTLFFLVRLRKVNGG